MLNRKDHKDLKEFDSHFCSYCKAFEVFAVFAVQASRAKPTSVDGAGVAFGGRDPRSVRDPPVLL